MLIYHPAFDLYNCVYRMLQLLAYMKENEVEVDRLRIWDFYLTFPKEARKISFPRQLKHLKEFIFKDKEANPYEDLIDSRRILERMKSYQLAALKCLASYGFIDKELLAKNIVKKTDKEIPKELQEKLNNLSVEKLNTIKLVQGFWELPLHGFKYRTGLIEYKYDVQ